MTTLCIPQRFPPTTHIEQWEVDDLLADHIQELDNTVWPLQRGTSQQHIVSTKDKVQGKGWASKRLRTLTGWGYSLTNNSSQQVTQCQEETKTAMNSVQPDFQIPFPSNDDSQDLNNMYNCLFATDDLVSIQQKLEYVQQGAASSTLDKTKLKIFYMDTNMLSYEQDGVPSQYSKMVAKNKQLPQLLCYYNTMMTSAFSGALRKQKYSKTPNLDLYHPDFRGPITLKYRTLQNVLSQVDRSNQHNDFMKCAMWLAARMEETPFLHWNDKATRIIQTIQNKNRWMTLRTKKPTYADYEMELPFMTALRSVVGSDTLGSVGSGMCLSMFDNNLDQMIEQYSNARQAIKTTLRQLRGSLDTETKQNVKFHWGVVTDICLILGMPKALYNVIPQDNTDGSRLKQKFLEMQKYDNEGTAPSLTYVGIESQEHRRYVMRILEQESEAQKNFDWENMSETAKSEPIFPIEYRTELLLLLLNAWSRNHKQEDSTEVDIKITQMSDQLKNLYVFKLNAKKDIELTGKTEKQTFEELKNHMESLDLLQKDHGSVQVPYPNMPGAWVEDVSGTYKLIRDPTSDFIQTIYARHDQNEDAVNETIKELTDQYTDYKMQMFHIQKIKELMKISQHFEARRHNVKFTDYEVFACQTLHTDETIQAYHREMLPRLESMWDANDQWTKNAHSTFDMLNTITIKSFADKLDIEINVNTLKSRTPNPITKLSEFQDLSDEKFTEILKEAGVNSDDNCNKFIQKWKSERNEFPARYDTNKKNLTTNQKYTLDRDVRLHAFEKAREGESVMSYHYIASSVQATIDRPESTAQKNHYLAAAPVF